jgi:hypothetical protein
VSGLRTRVYGEVWGGVDFVVVDGEVVVDVRVVFIMFLTYQSFERAPGTIVSESFASKHRAEAPARYFF